jgi:hypothetical protein
VGDKLVSSGFRNSITRGFASSDEPDVAVCLMPGTELAFESPVEAQVIAQAGAIRNFGQSVARFRQVNLETPLAHHDALEFPDGETILVTNLREGQRATVLQLPSTGVPAAHGTTEEIQVAQEPMSV